MIKNYAKISLLLTIIYVSGVQAWFVRVLNDTDGVIDVTVTNILCKDDVMSIQPGRIGRADTILCCYKAVTVEGKSGSIQGKKSSYNPSDTCMHRYLIAQKDQAGNVTLKTVEKGPAISIEIENMIDEQIKMSVSVPLRGTEYSPHIRGSKGKFFSTPMITIDPLAQKVLLNSKYPSDLLQCGYLLRFEIATGNKTGNSKEIPIPCKNSKFIVKQENGELLVTVESM